MKVDIERMEEVHIRLMELQRRIRETERIMEDARRSLNQQQIGGPVETAAINASLTAQVKAVERRAEGLERLAKVLRSAADQYHHCEEEAMGAAANDYGFIRGAILKPVIDGWPRPTPVPLPREKEIIRQLIMPLVAGRKETA